MLTDTAVRNAKPREKPFKLTDGGGLYVIVNPNGSRWWRFRYRVQGREKLISLGIYPEVSLREARERRDEANEAAQERRRSKCAEADRAESQPPKPSKRSPASGSPSSR